MNLKYTDGCTCTSFDVDGVEFIDLTKDKQHELAIKLINLTNSNYIFKDVYSYSVENSADLYDMSQDQLHKFYEQVDKKVEEFENNWSEEQKKNFCVKYITEYGDKDDDSWLYQHVYEKVLEIEGAYTDLGHCDCCGDHIRSYSLTI